MGGLWIPASLASSVTWTGIATGGGYWYNFSTIEGYYEAASSSSTTLVTSSLASSGNSTEPDPIPQGPQPAVR